MKILHINSSSRGAASRSLEIAEAFLREVKKRKNIEVDRFDLFSGELPEFAGLAVGAKRALFTGSEATAEQQQAWTGIKAVFDRFASADAYVINVPLWNNGLPYILKQFIDVVTQPGWAFGFDLEKGYSGLLKNKMACVIHASGVCHQGVPMNFGADLTARGGRRNNRLWKLHPASEPEIGKCAWVLQEPILQGRPSHRSCLATTWGCRVLRREPCGKYFLKPPQERVWKSAHHKS